MSRFVARVDFAQLPARFTDLAVTGDAAQRTLAGPGVALRFDAAHVAVAWTDDCLALATGRARGSGPQDAGDEAQRWIARYRCDGAAAASRIGGAFAVFILDLQQRRATLLVDRFAMETLCYRAQGSALHVADACRAIADGSSTFDPQAIFDYLYFHVIPAPETIVPGVRRVEHAGIVEVSRDGVAARRYWQPAFVETDHRDLAGRKREFLDLVRASVAAEADEPRTACFLSGGTDSSTVAGMLTRVRGEPAHAYSIGFESTGYDEMDYARQAAKHFGLVHHEYYVTPDDLVAAIPDVARSFDQPFGNSSVLPTYYCALRARDDGFTRLLAGDGGDELFGGNARYATQQVFEAYHALPRWLRSIVEPPAVRWPLFRKVPGLRQAGGYVRHSRVPMPARMETFNLLHRIGLSEVFTRDFLEQVDTGHPAILQSAAWQESDAASLVNRMLAYDWRFTLADSDLPKVRGATALAGVSVGYPFLSRELTDFSLRIPPDWKVRRLQLRWFFKDALRDFLPTSILRKKKHGFGLPFGPWCLRHPPLRAMATRALSALAERNVVRPEMTRDLVSQRLAEAPGYYGEMVWILMMLEFWMGASAQGRG